MPIENHPVMVLAAVVVIEEVVIEVSEVVIEVSEAVIEVSEAVIEMTEEDPMMFLWHPMTKERVHKLKLKSVVKKKMNLILQDL